MKSLVTSYLPVEAIQVPEHYLVISLPSWEVVSMQFLDEVARRFYAEEGVIGATLTDQQVSDLNINGFKRVAELKDYAIELFKATQKEHRFYQAVLPYLMIYIADSAQVVLNSEEASAYAEQVFDVLASQAAEQGQTLLAYVTTMMDKAEDPMAAMKAQVEEEYIFGLVGQQWYTDQGLGTTELDYEAYIQHNVLENHVDEIDVREALSYETFKQTIPVMMYTQHLFQHLQPAFKFVVSEEQSESEA